MVKKLKLPPYERRSDVGKVRSQWRKLTGLHGRDEPSAAIVRAATAVELSVNLAVRAEFEAQSELSPEAVDGMLRRANGLRNKMQNLLVPLTLGRPNEKKVKGLCKRSDRINEDRNNIVHGGYFSTRSKAIEAIERARLFIVDLVSLYEADFNLSPLNQDVLEDSTLGTSSDKGHKSRKPSRK